MMDKLKITVKSKEECDKAYNTLSRIFTKLYTV